MGRSPYGLDLGNGSEAPPPGFTSPLFALRQSCREVFEVHVAGGRCVTCQQFGSWVGLFGTAAAIGIGLAGESEQFDVGGISEGIERLQEFEHGGRT